MTVYKTKSFTKAYNKLPLLRQTDVDEALTLFIENHANLKLKDHPLKGRLKGLRAFSAAFDLRIVYRQEEKFVVITLLDVGTHNQVYP